MNVATITLEYTGTAWHARCITDPSAHTLGVGSWRGARVAIPGPTVVLDLKTAEWLREGLVDLALDLISVLLADVTYIAPPELTSVPDTLPEGPLAP